MVSSPHITATREEIAALFAGFSSLGLNCEFGLVQRAAGVEPLGLFRFAAVALDGLINALNARFAGTGSPEQIELFLDGSPPEYFVRDKAYRFYHHTWTKVSDKYPDEVLRKEGARIAFLVRMLIEELEEGRKVFLVKQGRWAFEATLAADLAAAIGRYGSAQLLWVDLADEDHPFGSVERLGPNLLKARIDRFAPTDNAMDFSFGSWAIICRAVQKILEPAYER